MESRAHQQLKRFATAFLMHHGCLAVAIEVKCAIPRYRADVAGWLDSRRIVENGDTRPRRRKCEPRTVIIECKQSREDFLRDRDHLEKLLTMREHLQCVRAAMEEQRVKVFEPHLRESGTALFPDMEQWNFSGSKLDSYRTLLRRLENIDRRLYGQTKFMRIARYRLADRLYVAAPRGVIRPRELPAGWGLLECPRAWLEEPPGLFDLTGEPALQVTINSPEHGSPEKFRLRHLRNIAVASTRAALRGGM